MADGGALDPRASALWRLARPFLLRLLRVSVSRDALLTLDEAVELLHGRDAEVSAWLRAWVRPVEGPTGELYLWGDVIDAMRRKPAQEPERRRTGAVESAGGLRRGSC